MSDPAGQYYALTNRPEVQQYLIKTYGKTPLPFEFTITDYATIQKIYLLRDIIVSAEKSCTTLPVELVTTEVENA